MRIPFLGQIGTSNKTQGPPMSETAPTLPMSQLLGHTTQAPDPGTVRPRSGGPPIGASGRANFYGLPQWDELNPKLIGPAGIRLLDEMYRTDAHVRRLVLAAWSPIVAGTWALEPYGGEDASAADTQIAETVWWMLNEWMRPNFHEHLMELGPIVIRNGFVPFEQIWATCQDPNSGKTLLGPRKLDLRRPGSVWRWWQDDYGDLTHIGQILPNKPDVVIPTTEVTYYRLAAEGDNWMGTSLLRHAYKHWFIKDRLERIDMIGQERKAVGVPIVYHSSGIHEDTLAEVEQAVASMHTSEVAYLMLPGRKMGTASKDSVDAGGEEWLVDVIQFDSSSGTGIQDSIGYHQTAIAASFLTDFLELGHHAVGARATAEVQEDPFQTAIAGGLLPAIVNPLDALIDRIVKLNWASAKGSPRLKLTLSDDASLSEISMYVQQLVSSGAMQVDPDLEDWLRERAGLPPADPQMRAQAQAEQQAQHDATVAQAQAQAQDPQGLKAAAAQAKLAPGGSASPTKPPGSATSAGASKSKPKSRSKSSSKSLDQPAGPIAAGLVVQAADSGRVLMIQRSDDKHDDDDTRARWEFPGGKLDDGETPWQAGVREWQEETGATLPKTAKPFGSFTSPDGRHESFGVRVPSETALTLGEHDPDEVAAVQWWPLSRLATDHRVRGKVQQALPDVHGLLDAKVLGSPIGALVALDAVVDWESSSDPADRRICIDFDGVICDKNTGLPVHDPITGTTAQDVLPKLAKDFDVVIFTAETDHERVRAWLRAHGLAQFAGAVTSQKVPAQAYVDDNGIEFTVWDRVARDVLAQVRRGRNPIQPKHLDAPSPPPNYRKATKTGQECGSCLMFDAGRCWGYGNVDVEPDQVCDSWAQGRANPKKPAGKAGDPNLPTRKVTELESAMQALVDTRGRREERDTTATRTRDKPSPAGSASARGASGSAPAEPSAKWFERLLSQDRLREAFDGCRDHIERAVGPIAQLEARKLAHHAANGTPLTAARPSVDLVNALAAHYTDMYTLGHQTVTDELAKQRHALGRQLDTPTGSETAGAVAGSRLQRARRRGEHSAKTIVDRIAGVLGRGQISALKPGDQLTTEAERAATAQLRIEALSSTAAMVNDGRMDAASAASDVVGAYYTSVMDDRSCDECIKADDGTLLTPEQAITLGPPNPLCKGGDFCRCALVWVLSSDPAALQVVEG